MASKNGTDYSLTELMIVEGARALEDEQVVFVGTGLPMAACMLAQKTHAPGLVLVAETGPINPEVLPGTMGVSDPRTWHGAVSIEPLLDVLGGVLQRGLCDVGFLGGAQVDRYGNLNSTCIGDWHEPRVRLVGSGGASDIAACAGKTYLMMLHERRRFVERCDYITSPGFLSGPGCRDQYNYPGAGPELVITDLGVFGFHSETKQLMAKKLHPGISLEQVEERTGFALEVAEELATTEPPTVELLEVLRTEVDPRGTYTRQD